MARTRVQEANEAVLLAVDRLVPLWEQYGTLSCHDVVVSARGELYRAALARRDAIAAQSLDDPEVYVRNGAPLPERQAAAAAMVARPGYRRLIYYVILGAGSGISDRGIEQALFRAGQARNTTLFGVEFPPQGLPHQTLSSARKSLVDCGLVYADGFEVVNGRKHTLWKARPLNAD